MATGQQLQREGPTQYQTSFYFTSVRYVYKMVYTNEEGIACTGCEYRSERPGEAFGHTRCSVHRLCTGWKYWEPSNCQHCSYLDACLKELDPRIRLAQMGKLKVMLDKVQKKVGELDSQRDWQ